MTKEPGAPQPGGFVGGMGLAGSESPRLRMGLDGGAPGDMGDKRARRHRRGAGLDSPSLRMGRDGSWA